MILEVDISENNILYNSGCHQVRADQLLGLQKDILFKNDGYFKQNQPSLIINIDLNVGQYKKIKKLRFNHFIL